MRVATAPTEAIAAALKQRKRPICAVSAAPEAHLRPAQSVDSDPPGKRSDFVDASEEFQRLCEYQLRLISEVFAYKGELVASIYIRLPGAPLQRF